MRRYQCKTYLTITISSMDLDHIQASSCNAPSFPTLEELLLNTISFSNTRHLWKKARPSKNGIRVLFSVLKRGRISENSLEVWSPGWARTFSSWVLVLF